MISELGRFFCINDSNHLISSLVNCDGFELYYYVIKYGTVILFRLAPWR